MLFDISNLISVLIGGLLVFFGHWFTSRQSAKIEIQRWKQEELREVRRDIVRFREKRAKPVIEALDRMAHTWDFDSIIELADAIGYEGEKPDTKGEEYKQQQRERKQKRFTRIQEDISSANVIHDPDLRKAVTKLLWTSTDPNAIPPKDTPSLQDVSHELENWIFNPKLDYNLIQSRGKVASSKSQSKKET